MKNMADNWSPKEIALFEACICAYGKDFHKMSQLVRVFPSIISFLSQILWRRFGPRHAKSVSLSITFGKSHRIITCGSSTADRSEGRPKANRHIGIN